VIATVLQVDEALWRPGNRWVVEGNLVDDAGTVDKGAHVIAFLKKADGTLLEIGAAAVDLFPVPGFDIIVRPIIGALDIVDVANDTVLVIALGSDGTTVLSDEIGINEVPPPLPHEGTQVVIEDVEVLVDDRLIIHGFASLEGGPATGSAVITTTSGLNAIAPLDPGPNPPAGGFDFVVRPIVGTHGLSTGDVFTIAVEGVGSATWVLDLDAGAPPAGFVPSVVDPAAVSTLRDLAGGGL